MANKSLFLQQFLKQRNLTHHILKLTNGVNLD